MDVYFTVEEVQGACKLVAALLAVAGDDGVSQRQRGQLLDVILRRSGADQEHLDMQERAKAGDENAVLALEGMVVGSETVLNYLVSLTNSLAAEAGETEQPPITIPSSGQVC